MIVKQLQPFVTTFSEALQHSHSHGDEVTVGGKITAILDMSKWLPDDNEQEPEEGVYLTLDDGVGYNQVVVPNKAFNIYQEEYDLKIGKIILAEGKLFSLDTSHTYHDRQGQKVIQNNHEDKPLRILSWEVKPLPEKIEEAQL